jgi:hypothetical protein
MRKILMLVLAAGLLSTTAFAVDNGPTKVQKANRRAQRKFLKAQKKAMKKSHHGSRRAFKPRTSH